MIWVLPAGKWKVNENKKDEIDAQHIKETQFAAWNRKKKRTIETINPTKSKKNWERIILKKGILLSNELIKYTISDKAHYQNYPSLSPLKLFAHSTFPFISQFN